MKIIFFPKTTLEALLGKIARELDVAKASAKEVTKITIEKYDQASSKYCRNK